MGPVSRTYVLCLLLSLASSAAFAEGDPCALLEGVDADELELARAVDRLPQDAVVVALAKDSGPRRTLALIRATPWLPEPTRALALLAAIMGGRDSVLAVAAASAVQRIVADLDAETLRAAELGRQDLASARSAMASVLDAEHVRPDIRGVAGVALASIDGWFGEAPTPAE